MTISSLPDEALIRLIAQEEVDALGELYDRYNRLVFSLSFYMLGDQETAEEITQDTFTRLWQQAAAYRPQQAKVKTWLVTIARNRTIDEFRRRKARPSMVFMDELVQSADGNMDEAIDERLTSERVRAALTHLPPNQREVLIMAYFGGYSQSEISTALSLPLGTVKTRIRLAMQKMRQNLGEEFSYETSK